MKALTITTALQVVRDEQPHTGTGADISSFAEQLHCVYLVAME